MEYPLSLSSHQVQKLTYEGCAALISISQRLPYCLQIRKAYTDYELEDFLRNELNIQLISQRRGNAKRKHDCYQQLKLSLTRNRVETTFSSIISMMPRWIRARTERGFCLKIVFFILAYTIKVSFL